MFRRARITGVYTAVVTPFDSRDRVDFKWMARHLEFQQMSGVDGVVVCGTNGEGLSLSQKERRSIVEFVHKRWPRLKLIVGGSFPSVGETIEFGQFCDRLRVEALLILPPYFDRTASADGLAEYFRRVAARVRTPIILYNIPHLSGVPITSGLLSRLRKVRSIIGIKDSTGDLDSVRTFVRDNPNLCILNGHDIAAAEALAAGASGLISGLSNVFPAQVVDIWRAHQKGRPTAEAQAAVAALVAAFDGLPQRAASKYALQFLGMPETRVRPPAVELTNQQKDLLRSRLSIAP